MSLTSAPVSTARTPFKAFAFEVSILTIRACGTEARKTLAHSRFSNGKSAAYFVSPVTFPSPSIRGSPFPMLRNAKIHLQVEFSILDFGFSIAGTRIGNSRVLRRDAKAPRTQNSKHEIRNSKQFQMTKICQIPNE